MKSLWGLLIALTGLFLVWLWATGRAKAVWDDVRQPGASLAGAGSTFSPASVNLTFGSKPPQATVPSIGSQSMNSVDTLPLLWNMSNLSVPNFSLPTNYIGNGSSGLPQVKVAVPLSQGFSNTPLGQLFSGKSSYKPPVSGRAP